MRTASRTAGWAGRDKGIPRRRAPANLCASPDPPLYPGSLLLFGVGDRAKGRCGEGGDGGRGAPRTVTRAGREFVMGIVIPTSSIETQRRLSVPAFNAGTPEGSTRGRASDEDGEGGSPTGDPPKNLASDYLRTRQRRIHTSARFRSIARAAKIRRRVRRWDIGHFALRMNNLPC